MISNGSGWECLCGSENTIFSHFKNCLTTKCTLPFSGCFILMTSEANTHFRTKSVLYRAAVSHGSRKPQRRGMERIQLNMQLFRGCTSIGWLPVVYKWNFVAQPNSSMNENKLFFFLVGFFLVGCLFNLRTPTVLALQVKLFFSCIFHMNYTLLCSFNYVIDTILYFTFFTSQVISLKSILLTLPAKLYF